MRLATLLAVAALQIATAEPRRGDRPDAGDAGAGGYAESLDRWRAAREARLRAPDGWLAVAGLVWLTDGDHVVGSASDAAVRLPEGAAPARVAVLHVRGEAVSIVPTGAADALRVGGRVPPRAGLPLRSDHGGAEPDVVSIGRLRLTIIERAGQLAVRLRDPDRPARAGFAGLRWYPIDPAYRVVARLVRAKKPVVLRLPNVVGKVEEMQSPGRLELTLRGRRLSLVPVLEPGEPRLFIIFRDATSGEGSYGGGRFVYGDPQPDGSVVVDFNQAYSPPCAFTPFATCVLPPKDNWLPVAIEAGERAPH